MPEKYPRVRANLTRREFEAQLIAKAWKDEAFKARLLRNPKEVFEEELGVSLSPSIEIRVLEERPNQLFLVLPPNPEQAPDLELSEEQLQMVSGGAGLPMFLLGMISPPSP